MARVCHAAYILRGPSSRTVDKDFPRSDGCDKNGHVSLSHRDASQAPDVDRAGELSASPPAQRLRSARWRDPRLWLGVLLVVASVLVGAALFSSADDTVAVWAVDHDVSAGMPLTADDVHAVRVHFDESGGEASYLTADDALPADARAGRDLAAGELVAVSAVADVRAGPDRLPLAVSAGGLPAGLVVGDTVDVWAQPSLDAAGADQRPSRQVLDDVMVMSLGAEAAGGLDTAREVLVALPGQTDVGDVLDGLRGSDVILVLVGD